MSCVNSLGNFLGHDTPVRGSIKFMDGFVNVILNEINRSLWHSHLSYLLLILKMLDFPVCKIITWVYFWNTKMRTVTFVSLGSHVVICLPLSCHPYLTWRPFSSRISWRSGSMRMVVAVMVIHTSNLFTGEAETGDCPSR